MRLLFLGQAHIEMTEIYWPYYDKSLQHFLVSVFSNRVSGHWFLGKVLQSDTETPFTNFKYVDDLFAIADNFGNYGISC